MVKTIGIVGYGSFGQFVHMLARMYCPDVVVKVWSRKQLPDTRTFFTFEEVCACDVLIMTVSIAAFEEVLMRAMVHVGPETIVVDVATVKMHPIALLQKYAGGKTYIATHPMFGPYSFAKRGNVLDGLRLVISDHTLNDDMLQSSITLFKRLGLNVLFMDANAHDRMLAETLFLTHYIGQTVARAGFVRTDIDTVSFGYLMDAVESVQNDTTLFEEVYRFNPYCKETVGRFEDAQQAVRTML